MLDHVQLDATAAQLRADIAAGTQPTHAEYVAQIDGAPLRHCYDALTPVDMAAYRRRCAEIRSLDERADRAREVLGHVRPAW